MRRSQSSCVKPQKFRPVMKKILLVVAALLPFFSFAQQIANGLTASNGKFIGFYEYKPANYSTYSGKLPVVIFLHGIVERGNGTTDLPLIKKVAIPKYLAAGKPMNWTLNGKTESFIVLSPQLSTAYGSWQNFYIDEMINYAVTKLKGDPNRIILTGLSLGGGATWKYISTSTTNSAKIAGAAPICGTCSMSSPSYTTNANIAVWAFHNKTDKTISYTCSENAVNKINALNPATKALLTLYPSGTHNAWDKAYDFTYNVQNPNFWEWCLGQNRSLAPNKVPTANAGSNASISTSTGTVTLRGSGSDADGYIERYAWKKLSGPAYGTITTPGAATTTVTGLTVAGTYVYQLMAMDNRASWAHSTVTITVTGGTANTAPVARAGADQTIKLPTSTVTLNGSTSTDADGTIAKYAWTKVSTLAATITSAASASTTITGLVAGTHTFTLTVTDNLGSSHSDDVVITVSPANAAPVAKAGSDITIKLPANTATLNGSTSTDADGTIAKFAWTKVSTLAATIATPATASTSITGLVQGTHTFRLTVTDNLGATHSDDVQIIVTAATNTAPVANAGSDATITLPANTATLSGSGSDQDGTISKYAWTKISTLAATISSSSSASTSITGLVQGTHTFRLTVTDNSGATHSDDVVITVNPGTSNNIAPVANAGSNVSLRLPSSSTTLKGTATDQDGSIAKYNWTKVSGLTATIASPTAASTSVTGLVEGTHTFRLTVTDNNGATHSDDVDVKVEAANVPPVAKAGNDINLLLPTTSTTLDGSSSTDQNGYVKYYAWTKISSLAATIASPTAATTALTGLATGIHTFRLTVKDNHGASATDDVLVIVATTGAINIAPVANAGNDVSVTLPATTATLTGSGTDQDGTIGKYQWTKVTALAATITSSTTASTTITGLVAGTHTFRLTVTDNSGATHSDDVTVNVVNPAGSSFSSNKLPVANAGPDKTAKTSSTTSVIVDGNASYDSDGTIQAYAWSQVSGPSALIKFPSNPGTSMRNLTPGTYVFRLTVTDNSGGKSSDDVTVVIHSLTSEVNTTSDAVAFDQAATNVLMNEKLSLYPNPASANVTLNIASAEVGSTSINLYDVSGKMVKRVAIQKGLQQMQHRLDLSGLKTGAYTVEVVVNQKSRLVSRFIKQ